MRSRDALLAEKTAEIEELRAQLAAAARRALEHPGAGATAGAALGGAVPAGPPAAQLAGSAARSSPGSSPATTGPSSPVPQTVGPAAQGQLRVPNFVDEGSRRTELGEEEELRIDPSDGNAYPLSSFLEVYGGYVQWDAAKPLQRRSFRATDSPLLG